MNPKSVENNEIFVFGSNRQGRHGAGAALHARTRFGAVYGQAEGLQGQSYGIVTKELRPDAVPVGLSEVADGVTRFLRFAREHPTLRFFVSRIGCGLAGFTPDEIAPLFKGYPANVRLNTQFADILTAKGEYYGR